jgi:phosphoenolpyruvate carboxylase
MKESFDQAVSTRYHIYNSLFLNLPFSNVYRTGTLLPLFQQAVESGFKQGKSPEKIISKFFTDYANEINPEEQFDLLFNFIQYVERQVVLFDSIEDAAFDTLNDRKGKGTLSALLLRAAAEGTMDTLGKKVEDFKMRLVLTAHPTQFYPGHVLAIINDLEQAIRDNELNTINLLLQQLGKTGFINREKPTPFDEALSLCWYLENVFYQTVPTIISNLSQGLQLSSKDWSNYNLITIGFWPGGDRDGNPFVTSEITLRVAERLRETILKCYHRDIRLLRRRLTFRGVEQIIISVERKLYNSLVSGRNEYEIPDKLIKELLTAREILVQDHNSLFLDQLDSFLLKVKLFGFFFASLDIRQDSRKHTQAWEDILPKTVSKKMAKLQPDKQIAEVLKTKFSINLKRLKNTTAEDVVGSLIAVKEIQQRNGEKACHRYIISNCRSALDIIRVFQLARLVFNESKNLPIDVIPLFETIDDLTNAEAIMEELFSIPVYKAHLKKRKSKQTIMLGFSDGTKDGGYLKANWSIFKAKENLTRVSRNHGIDAIFFDGRGGPPARGGGNTHDFYASLGNQIESKEIQITIQGQTISSGFGKPASCQYNLEQLLSAGIENEVFNAMDELTIEDKQLIDQLANEGYKAYLALKQHPLFVPYLEKVTPLLFFGETNIGSRPAKRNADSLSLDDLRAIPFVGTWAQMKQNIPGFYGVGSALQALQRDGKWKQLQDLYKRSLFFRTLLGNSMMSLRKTYYPATRHLQHDTTFGELWKMMYSEYKLSVDKILGVTGMNELLENNPLNRDSIQLRERIVLPLIAIQQYALQNLRNKNPEKESKKFRQLVLRCTFGIINAGRNSA